MTDADRMASLRRAVYGLWVWLHTQDGHPQISPLWHCQEPMCRMIAVEYRASMEPETGGETP